MHEMMQEYLISIPREWAELVLVAVLLITAHLTLLLGVA
jgi:hypothetical protein